MSLAPFPIDVRLTGLVIAFKNPTTSLIADQVLPRFGGIEGRTFKWIKRSLGEHFDIPDTKVGRKSEPATVEFGGSEQTATCEAYGLDDIVPNEDIENAPPGYDPQATAAEGIAGILELDRERRVAQAVFAASAYSSPNKVQLAGNDQWSAYTQAASDPIEDITLALDTPVVRPNTLVFGQATWSKLSRHPVIMQAIHGTDGDKGIARRQQIADLFEVQNVLIGASYVNSARPGQTVSLARCWGKHMAALYIDPTATTKSGLTFGVTAQFGQRVAGTIPEPKMGLLGSQRVRVGEYVEELILAAEVGYFIEDAVA